MNLEKSQTLQCLINAFAGESEARNRYTFYSKIAKEEGYEKISEVFLETANNEMEHAKLFYKEIPNNTQLKVSGMYPIYLGNTYKNLVAAHKGENEEWSNIYKISSQIAKDENFNKISILFKNISEIEKMHAERYEKISKLLNTNTFFNKEEKTIWICRKCGHTELSKDAPIKCPVCGHPQAYFQINSESF